MSKRLFLWVGGSLAAVGLIFTAIAAWMAIDDRVFHANAVEATGTVVDLERRQGTARMSDSGARQANRSFVYAPVVEWRDDEGTRHFFTAATASQPPAYERGEAVRLFYPPGRPSEARIDSFTERHALVLGFGGLGSVLAVCGLMLIAIDPRRRKVIAELKRTGLPLEAEFIECYRDRRIALNGRNPWRVAAQAVHPLTGKVHRFDSEPVWVDLRATLEGKTVKVLYDPENVKRHYVDLSDHTG